MKKKQALRKMKTDLQLRGLAPRTQEKYQKNVKVFFKFSGVPIKKLNEDKARDFLSYLINERNLAAKTVNTYSAAIRFFFAVTLNRPMNYLQIPLMKTPKQLPVIASREEITKLIDSCENLKYKIIILLAYGSGLRISEIARLKTSDIKSNEMRLFVQGAKGQKDRYTLLPQNTLETLRLYWKKYKPNNAENWIFPSNGYLGHITTGGIRYAIETTVLKSSITTHVTAHMLRHDFATHLLEDGVELVKIKELLGHASIKTTVLYLHLANITQNIKSPVDTLNKSGGNGK
jgi:site-specific recombinase XerD